MWVAGEGVGEAGGGDSLISNCIEKSSQLDYFILILFNLLAKAMLQYDPNYNIENQKQHILMGNGVKYCLSFFLKLPGGRRRCTLYTSGCKMKAYK